MKEFRLVFFALIFSLTAAGVARTAAPVGLEPGTQNAIAAAVNKDLAAYGGAQPVPGVVIGVWVPGKGEFTKGFGYSDLAMHSPMALDDHFRIGSNTKTF